MTENDRKKFERLVGTYGVSDSMLELEMWLFKRLDGSRPRERLYKAVQAARRVFLDDLHDVESLMMSHPNQSNEEPADAS